MWDLINNFEAFNIQSVPRRIHVVVDALVVLESSLQPLEKSKLKKFFIELVAIPTILDNVTNFQVFQDDQQILEFIMSVKKTNSIPKGMVALEQIFDKEKHTHERGKTPTIRGDDCELYNLSSQLEPREVHIGKVGTTQEKR